MEMGDGMNIFTDFLTLATILLAGVTILIAFFVLALQIFRPADRVQAWFARGLRRWPWGVFSGTAYAGSGHWRGRQFGYPSFPLAFVAECGSPSSANCRGR